MTILLGEVIDPADFRGLIFPYAGPTAPTGFLMCDGAAVSRAVHADLFALIGTTYGAGDGATTFNVPDLRGSVIVGAGQRVRTMDFDGASAVDPATDQITVTSNEWLITGQAVVLSGASLPTGVSAATYYVIRVSATVIKLASTLANAQNGAAVNITADGSGTCTLTQTLTSRTLGQSGGEESHAMSLTEILAHTHGMSRTPNGGGPESIYLTANTDASDVAQTQTDMMRSVGGNAAMNVMNPFTVLNFIIKT